MKSFAIVAAILLLAGCPNKNRIHRDAGTYTAEVLSSLQRQEAAEKALITAAIHAKKAGDMRGCKTYAVPALIIRAKARSQAMRALWLAGLPYIVKGEVGKAPQPDPGSGAKPEPVSVICGGNP